MRRFLRRALRWLGVVVLAVFAAIQLVPYGRDHTNPPVTREPTWDRPETRALAVRACFDCHSNETVWRWYSHIAPVSWLVQRDVDEGRRELNYSEWDRPQKEAHESAKSVRKNEMPPWFYEWPGTPARLSPAERAALIAGLEATFGRERRDKKEDD
jgi:mono/diheme cytochrome c family protein